MTKKRPGVVWMVSLRAVNERNTQPEKHAGNQYIISYIALAQIRLPDFWKIVTWIPMYLHYFTVISKITSIFSSIFIIPHIIPIAPKKSPISSQYDPNITSFEYNPHLIQISFHRFFFDSLSFGLGGPRWWPNGLGYFSSKQHPAEGGGSGCSPDALGFGCVDVDTCMLHDHI